MSIENDRARGLLLGLAVGDALGTTLEFSARDGGPPLTDMVGGGPFSLRPGQWTDDTSMALALADSLITRGRLDPADLADRFVRWWKEGAYSCTGSCFDIGVATRAALDRYLRTGEPFAGATDERSAGNGSIMRLAPAVLYALHDPVRLRSVARDQGRITHGAPQALEACEWLAARLRQAVLGAGKADVLAADEPDEAGKGHPEFRPIRLGRWKTRTRDRIRSFGYVVDTLEAALWAVERTASFAEAVLLAVNLGDDADTVGAVAGQLAGALYGRGGIPNAWLARLAWREQLERMADALLVRAGPRTPGPDDV